METNLESVLNINSEMAAALVSQFNTGNLPFFERYFYALPTVHLETGANKNSSVDETLFIEEDHIGEGGFGTIYRDRANPYVYKKIPNYEGVLSYRYLKTNFKEAIIQTLLSSDAKYGSYVCKLYKVYREGNDFVFKFEPLQSTLGLYIHENKYEEHTYEVVEKVLLKLIEILNYFYVRYGFNHNDLSTDNIMTTNKADFAENLKLIDFGKSVLSLPKIGKPGIKIGTKTLYSVIKYDLLEEKRKLFAKLVNLPPETPIKNLTNILKTRKIGSGKRRTKKSYTGKYGSCYSKE